MNKKHPKHVFLTGGTSGIGLQTAALILLSGHKLILPCRNEKSLEIALKQLREKVPSKVIGSNLSSTPILDLSDISTISKCISYLRRNDQVIDILILNAGIQYTGSKIPKWSKQNIELTFAVNHLGHQYLTQRLLPLINVGGNSKIIITSSEVHNPQTPGGKVGQPAGLGNLEGLKSGKGFSMIDGSLEFNADKAYKDSKLCNLLFAKELHRKLLISSNTVKVIAWAPGLVIPKTNNSFFRYSRKYNEIGQRLFGFIARDILRITSTTFEAGKLLKEIALDLDFDSKEFEYFSNRLVRPGKFIFERSSISKEANNIELSIELWKQTEKLIYSL